MSREGCRGVEKGSEASFRPFKNTKDDEMHAGLQREVAADERGDGLLVVNGGDGLSELLGDRDGLDFAADLDGNGVGDEALDDRGVVQTLSLIHI